MILICSDEREPTTDLVCNWLNYYNKKFIRISYKNIIFIHKIEINNNSTEIYFYLDNKNNLYKLSDFTSYWYRRSFLNFNFEYLENYKFNEDEITNELNAFLTNEFKTIKYYFEYKLDTISKLNNYIDNNINKLQVIDYARKIGLNIPNTLITNYKNEIFNFISSKTAITKAISDFVVKNDDNNYFIYTSIVTDESMNQLNEINYSLLQEMVNKYFELRIFFFNNKFYSSAIFSQDNEKTKTDFRNYDFENPNRVVPFKLPKGISKKLKKVLNKFNLNSGSIDMAFTNNNDYVLFEINPIGQFEQVSFPCNYNLYKKIAKYL
jgi:ATP-GRASP peptide maturase of grasp-with-spasm system